MEREAQDDPFLMDALEGYAATGGNQQANLDMLSQQLNQRADKKERRIIPWTYISIAATVLGFLFVVGLLYKNNEPVSSKLQAARVEPLQSTDTTKDITAPILADKEKEVAALKPNVRPFTSPTTKSVNTDKGIAVQIPAAGAPLGQNEIEVVKDSTSALDDRVMGYVAKQNTDSADMQQMVAVKKPVYVQVLASKVKGVQKSEPQGKRNEGYYLNGVRIPTGQLEGVVLSHNDGVPLPGVTVKVDGRAKATQTDANGKFVLPDVTAKDVVSFGYVGYDSKKLRVNPNDSLRVEMNASSSSLNEVVVTNAVKAYPKNGWDAFNDYIKKSGIVALGDKTGIVQVKFTVNPNGNITGVKVSQSLNQVADEKAIKIIRNGPAWVGSAKPEVITVNVEFEN